MTKEKKLCTFYVLYFLGWTVLSLFLPFYITNPWGPLIGMLVANIPLYIEATVRRGDSLLGEIFEMKPQSRRPAKTTYPILVIVSVSTFWLRREPSLPLWLSPFIRQRWIVLVTFCLISATYFYIRGFRMTPEDFIDPDEEEEE